MAALSASRCDAPFFAFSPNRGFEPPGDAQWNEALKSATISPVVCPQERPAPGHEFPAGVSGPTLVLLPITDAAEGVRLHLQVYDTKAVMPGVLTISNR